MTLRARGARTSRYNGREYEFTGCNRYENKCESVTQDRKLVVVVVLGNTNLDGEVLAVVHRVELSEEDVAGDEHRTTGMRNVKGDECGSTTASQVHDIILVIELVSITIDDVCDRLQILNV